MRSGFAASCLGVLLALAGCATDRVPPAPGQPQPPEALESELERQETRVGLLLPLSGAAAALGQDMARAAEMALFDVGANDLVLLPRDTGGSAEGARIAAEQVSAEGAGLILGPLFSRAVRGVAPVAQATAVPAIAFSNDASARGQGVFLLGFRPEEQVNRVVRFALERGLTRIAGLAPDDPYGAAALNALREAVLQGGGELASMRYYPPDLDPSGVVREIAAYDQRRAALEAMRRELTARNDDQARAELARLRDVETVDPPPFDAILVADGGDRLRSVASLLTFYDVDPASVRFLGTMRWQDDPRVLDEGALQGGWFAAPPPTTMQAFMELFRSVFGREPQQPALVALAYDATALAVIIARDLGDPTFSPATLVDPEGFTGATGLFRLRADGLADHGLAVLEVAGPATAAIDPAPTTFVDVVAAR